MAWIRIDDHFDEHPKIAQVGPLGVAFWVTGLAYCNRNLTDGYIPWAVAQKLVAWEYLAPPDEQGRRKQMEVDRSCGMTGDNVHWEEIADLLVFVGLWEIVDDGDTRYGFQVHDYDQYQPTREQVEAERENKRAGGRARAAQAQTREGGRFTPAEPATNQQPAGSLLQQEHQQETSSNPNPNPCVPESTSESTHVGLAAKPDKKKPQPKPEPPEVRELFNLYKARIQPGARLCPTDKITARLKTFSAADLRQGIENFAANPWRMEHNAEKGATWFFDSDKHAEEWLLLGRNGHGKDQPDPQDGAGESPFAKYDGNTGGSSEG